jgi:hypothetical protein
MSVLRLDHGAIRMRGMAATDGLGSLAQLVPTQAPTAVAAEAAWWAKIIYDPVNLISISLAVIAVVLGIIPLVLLRAERQKTRLLDAAVEEFGLLEKARLNLKEEIEKGNITRARKEEIEAEVATMREDVEKRIPQAALKAYYENTIPQVELQIVDLGARLSDMRRALLSITSVGTPVNPRVQEILSEEISKNVGARRNLEQLQILLIICTTSSAALIAIIPFPVSVLVSFLGASLSFYVCYLLFIAARMAFPDSKILRISLLQSRPRVYKVIALTAVFSGLIVFSAIFWLAWHIANMRD